MYGLPATEAVPLTCLHCEHDVFQRRELGEDRCDLVGAHQSQQAARMDRQARDVVSVEFDDACIGRDLAGELADECGLAGAIGTDQSVDAPCFQVQIDVVRGQQAAITLNEAAYCEPSHASALL